MTAFDKDNQPQGERSPAKGWGTPAGLVAGSEGDGGGVTRCPRVGYA